MTLLRGNTQVLPNGNVLGGWSSSGYFSEFTDNGTLVLEGNLGSIRMSTYRTYKFGIDEVRLFPAEPIALVCQTAQLSSGEPSAGKLGVMYVSWNGATEVTKWQFAVSDDENVEQEKFVILGSKEKSGFETIAQFNFNQVGSFAVAYALDAVGNVLGKSTPVVCNDMVGVGSKSHLFEDPAAYYKPSGSFALRPPVVEPGHTLSTSDGSDGDDFNDEQEGGDGVVEAGVSASPAATSSDGVKKQQEQSQGLPTPSPSASISGTRPDSTSPSPHTPPTTNPIKHTFLPEGEFSPRPITTLLFLSVALAGMLLLMRRRSRRQV
jgi:hypothetical protein